MVIAARGAVAYRETRHGMEVPTMELIARELIGRHVRLEPLEDRHRELLRTAADDERIWEHTVSVARGPGFGEWFSNARTLRDHGHEIPFVVRLVSSGRVVGSTRFLHPVPMHKRVEIGATWYCPDVWGTVVNPECKLLLLQHAFEVAGANRVELCTDMQNHRSQAAIAKLGAVREGVLRSHMVVRNGRVRDTVLYSITRAEWPAVKTMLEVRVGGS
jgi:RimJ/RimL family protein N-acetyltransferase